MKKRFTVGLCITLALTCTALSVYATPTHGTKPRQEAEKVFPVLAQPAAINLAVANFTAVEPAQKTAAIATTGENALLTAKATAVPGQTFFNVLKLPERLLVKIIPALVQNKQSDLRIDPGLTNPTATPQAIEAFTSLHVDPGSRNVA